MALVVIVVLVHTAYELLIRPRAAAAMREAAELRAESSEVEVPQSLAVILKDYEQEACFILMDRKSLFAWPRREAVSGLKGMRP